MIIFAVGQRRQRVAGDGQRRAAQRLGGGAIGHLGEARDRAIGAGPHRLERQRGVARLKQRIVREIVGEQLEPQLALDAVRADDGGEGHALVSIRHHQTRSC